MRVIEDAALMERIAKEGIPLECCPTSNLQTQVYKDISEYPVRTFLEAGVKFTINTDNTAVSMVLIFITYVTLFVPHTTAAAQ